MIRTTAFLIAALAALPALAQSTYQRECRTSYSGSEMQTSCTSTYTPPPEPPKPVEHMHVGPGSRQDVVVSVPVRRVFETGPERPVTFNHCGVGYVYTPGEGCEVAKKR